MKQDAKPAAPPPPKSRAPEMLLIAAVAASSFAIGAVFGFTLGLLATRTGKDLVESVQRSERPAIVSSTRRVDRERFFIRYPANWKVDVTDDDYNPDHLFAIQSPGQAFVMFAFYKHPSELSELLEAQADDFAKIIDDMKRTDFDNWGFYSGKGALLKGKIMGSPATVRVFAHSTGRTSFVVVEQRFDDHLAMVKPGFDLIEESFRLKEKKAEEQDNKLDGEDKENGDSGR